MVMQRPDHQELLVQQVAISRMQMCKLATLTDLLLLVPPPFFLTGLLGTRTRKIAAQGCEMTICALAVYLVVGVHVHNGEGFNVAKLQLGFSIELAYACFHVRHEFSFPYAHPSCDNASLKKYKFQLDLHVIAQQEVRVDPKASVLHVLSRSPLTSNIS